MRSGDIYGRWRTQRSFGTIQSMRAREYREWLIRPRIGDPSVDITALLTRDQPAQVRACARSEGGR